MDVRIETIGADNRLMEFVDIRQVETSEGEFQQISSVKIDDDGVLVVSIPRHCTARCDGASGCPPSVTILSM